MAEETSNETLSQSGARFVGRSSGQYAHGNWWLHLRGDDPRTELFATGHEQAHQMLEETTSFGALTLVLGRIAALDLAHLNHLSATVAALVRMSSQVHEGFATWTPALMWQWDRAEVAAKFPIYARYYDMFAELAPVRSPYLRWHIADVVSRSCMEWDGLAELAEPARLGQLRGADIRLAGRPDARLARLRRTPLDWRVLETDTAEAFPDAVHLFGLADMTTAFDFANLSAMERVNRFVHRAIESHLAAHGMNSGNRDERLELAARLVAAGEQLAGVPLGLDVPSEEFSAARVMLDVDAIHPDTEAAHNQGLRESLHDRVYRTIGLSDSEGFTVSEPLTAVVMDSATPLTEMASSAHGTAGPHLFLTIRHGATLADNYLLKHGAALPTGPRAFLRRPTPQEEVGHAIELLDVTEVMPRRRAQAPLPVVTIAPWSLLGTERVNQFAQYMHPQLSAVLFDAPFAENLRYILAHPGSVLRYTFLQAQGALWATPLMVARIESAPANSHILLKPLTHAAVSSYRSGFALLDPQGQRLVNDTSLLTESVELLALVIDHLIGEEVVFPPPRN